MRNNAINDSRAATRNFIQEISNNALRSMGVDLLFFLTDSLEANTTNSLLQKPNHSQVLERLFTEATSRTLTEVLAINSHEKMDRNGDERRAFEQMMRTMLQQAFSNAAQNFELTLMKKYGFSAQQISDSMTDRFSKETGLFKNAALLVEEFFGGVTQEDKSNTFIKQDSAFRLYQHQVQRYLKAYLDREGPVAMDRVLNSVSSRFQRYLRSSLDEANFVAANHDLDYVRFYALNRNEQFSMHNIESLAKYKLRINKKANRPNAEAQTAGQLERMARFSRI